MEAVVEFKVDLEQPTGGRRAKMEKEKKRKMKPGTFGMHTTFLHSFASCYIAPSETGRSQRPSVPKERLAQMSRPFVQKRWGSVRLWYVQSRGRGTSCPPQYRGRPCHWL